MQKPCFIIIKEPFGIKDDLLEVPKHQAKHRGVKNGSSTHSVNPVLLVEGDSQSQSGSCILTVLLHETKLGMGPSCFRPSSR
jgi:hypothetical protein